MIKLNHSFWTCNTCGHRSYIWDYDYGGCFACGSHNLIK